MTEAAFRIGQRSQSSYLRGKISKFSLYDGALSDEQVALRMKLDVIQHIDRVAKSGLDPKEHDSTAEDAALAFLDVSNGLHAAKAKLLAERKQLIAAQQTTMVMQGTKR